MKNFAFFLLLSLGACASSNDQQLVPGRGGPGSISLRESDICRSDDGKTFKREHGGVCKKGDLIYINLAFDSDRAADAADAFCDFDRVRPPEAMDVYGFLCYSRVVPPAQTANP